MLRLTEKQAAGVRKGSQMKLVCAFDLDTWQQIRKRAERDKSSVAEQVRQLVEWGLEAAE